MKSYFLCLGLLLIPFSMCSQKITISPEVRMLALGDSYTIGQSVAVNERWPHQFTDLLRKNGVTAEYPDYIATTGWTTRNLLDGIETMLNKEKNYNLVSILIGVNNQYQGLDIELYEPELRQIIESALEIAGNDSSRLFMLSIPDYAYTPFGRGSNSISNGIDDYNAINKRVAQEYGLCYVDITPISRQGLRNTSLVASDGLHPSGLQYSHWVNEIISRLDYDSLVETASELLPSNTAGKQIEIFPNPTQKNVIIRSGDQPDSIRIWDIHGSLVKEIQAPDLPLNLDISGLDAGIYVLESIESEKRVSIRFVVR